jgi:hypothetical protein
MVDDLEPQPMKIESRADFVQWAIERSRAIVADQGGDLALAARDMSDDKIAESANALGQAIVDALLEVFDGLLNDD